jgi:hypothetical protein
MRKLSTFTELVDGGAAYAELARYRRHREHSVLDPIWTRRFVFLHCGMGDSGIRPWYGPE